MSTKSPRRSRRRRRPRPLRPSRSRTYSWAEEARPGADQSTVYFRVRDPAKSDLEEAQAAFNELLVAEGLDPMSLPILAKELLMRGMAPEHALSETSEEAKKLEKVFRAWLRS